MPRRFPLGHLISVLSSLGLAIFPVASWAGGNLVVDPGFENSGQGWTYTDNAGPDPVDPAHTGTWSGYVNGCCEVTGQNGIGSISQALRTIPGHTYKVSFWLASNSCAQGNLTVSFANNSKSWTNLARSLPWTQYSFTATASTGGEEFAFSGTNINCTYFIDDVSVVDTADSTRVIDGYIEDAKSYTVVCQNTTTKQQVAAVVTGTGPWDCYAMGLTTAPGEKFKVTLSGVVQ